MHQAFLDAVQAERDLTGPTPNSRPPLPPAGTSPETPRFSGFESGFVLAGIILLLGLPLCLWLTDVPSPPC
jgi:hypothetical protein